MISISNDIVIRDGFIFGGWREPENIWKHLTASIHDDEIAQKVGMRGGTITGITHLNLFPPLLLKIFGDPWFKRGSLSMYYTYATTHREKVRAVIELPPKGEKNVQVEARVEMPDDQVVAKGTVSVGKLNSISYLRSMDLISSKPEELRILEGFNVGDEIPSREVLVTQEQADKGLESITDLIDYYKEDTRWGKTILSPSAMYSAMALGMELLDSHTIKAVPFYGATEIRNIEGPIKVGIPYKASGKLISVGVSRKTEYFWYDSILEEKESGKKVAEMRHMNRFMKSSSPKYQTS